MKSAILKPILILLILLVLGSTRQVCVQHEQAALATHVADAISHWKLKSVVVLDFDGSEQSGMLGAGLASDLSNLLVSQGAHFKVEDRVPLKQIIDDNYLRPRNFSDPGVGVWLAGEVKAEGLVLGKFYVGANASVTESVTLYRAKDGKSVRQLPDFSASRTGYDCADWRWRRG